MPSTRWIHEQPPQTEEDWAVFDQMVEDGFGSIADLCIWRERGTQRCIRTDCAATRTVERSWVDGSQNAMLGQMIQIPETQWRHVR